MAQFTMKPARKTGFPCVKRKHGHLERYKVRIIDVEVVSGYVRCKVHWVGYTVAHDCWRSVDDFEDPYLVWNFLAEEKEWSVEEIERTTGLRDQDRKDV
ncbi:hypothetical protein LTR08_004467 [Meristemomyces frigidus]|nr:hypothetical protein LTR08_004467 [Meristemomyces frigidus]